MNPDVCPICLKELGKLFWMAPNSDRYFMDGEFSLGISKVWEGHFKNKHTLGELNKFLNE